MAKDRLIPCAFYICENDYCEKGNIATHNNKCQKCVKYIPRARVQMVTKKQKNKYRDSDYKKEMREYCC